ncbi:MAG: glycosyltransferase family 4 protein [Acutalibacteraceae bacterium]|jgi:glycosyltransferase involved in cell wall biosynthesis|nr:glycosyltransferase family 4 protein [Acutalibacteraceae bacterium]
MKILMVNKFLYPRGGAETYMLKLGESLEKRGHMVEYFGMYDEKNTVGNSENLSTFNMDFHSGTLKRFVYPFKIVYSFEARRKLTALIKKFKPDIVHFNNINFQLTPSVIDAAAVCGVPIVWTMHDYQSVCPNHLLYRPSDGIICEKCIGGSRLNCVKYKCIHNSRIKSIIGAVEGVLYSKKKTYKTVDCFICPSTFLQSVLLKKRDIFGDKTEVVQNFTEIAPLDGFDINEKLKNKYVVFAGRFFPEKGISLIAGAARLLPDVQFVIAGSGPQQHLLEGIDNVYLTGFLTGDKLKQTIAGACAMLVPSVWYENCPLSILESQSLGTLVITANIGGMAELVEDGVDGIRIKELSPKALAEAIKTVLSNDGMIKAMSENCRKKRKSMMTLEKYTDKAEQIYKKMIWRKSDAGSKCNHSRV